MTNRPQVIARFIPPQLGGIVTVDENQKAVVIRGGAVVDMFSGGSRDVAADAEVVVASLQPYRMVIGFGNCPESERVHALRSALHTLEGEEIGCMTATIQFALIRDDRANVQKLLSVPRQSNEITVANLAADMDINIHTAIQDAVADSPRSSGISLKTDFPWIREIRQGLQPIVESEFREYGLSVKGVHLNVVDTPDTCIENGGVNGNGGCKGKGGFWVYEDDPTNWARVHKKSCRYCTPCGRRDETVNRWHGPFASRDAAFVAMRALGKRNARGCGACNP